MTAKRPSYDPDRTYHVQVDPGRRVVYQDQAFGQACTLQVPGSEVPALLAQGARVVDPAKPPDAGSIE